MNDLDQAVLRRALPGWVTELRYFSQTDSTNRQAAAWAQAGAPHGSLVIADFQTAGRGRLGRRWLAPAGSSLLFSVVLRPGWDPQLFTLVSLAGAVALCECLEEKGIAAAVKWPNDVLIGERKVSGILAEAAAGVVVLGMGVNVKQERFPPEIQATATSLQASTGRRFDRSQLLAGLIRRLASLVDGPAPAVVDRYRRWCETLGRWVRVDGSYGPVEDRAVDVDSTGALILEHGDIVRAGDVYQIG